jgi:hypothetical protein
MVRSSLCGDLIEGEAADGVTGAIAGPRLPAPNGCVEVLWIDLDAIASRPVLSAAITVVPLP